MAERFNRIPETALEWHRDGRGAVLATVISTWGSAPRPVGSQLAVSSRSEIEGSVSGGCVEGAVVAESLEALGDGRCRILEYGVSNEEAFSVGLACGGNIRVLVEPIGVGAGPDPDLIASICDARRERRAIACFTNLANWERRLLEPRDGDQRVFERESTTVGEDFVLVHNPPLRMVVVGGVHIAQPLLAMAHLAGYATTLVDPRDSFASAERFPGETIVRDWPDEALHAHGLDARTAVVTLTHDPKLDDPAIRTALASDVFYLGCLGSRATHAKRVERLEESGISRSMSDRIHAPIGLEIGASSPAEIAVAIMAEITLRLRRGARH